MEAGAVSENDPLVTEASRQDPGMMDKAGETVGQWWQGVSNWTQDRLKEVEPHLKKAQEEAGKVTVNAVQATRDVTVSAFEATKNIGKLEAPPTSFTMWVDEAKKRIGSDNLITAENANKRLSEEDNILLIDVRDEKDRREKSRIVGSVHISLGTLPFKADPEMVEYKDPILADRDHSLPIILTCGQGGQALIAGKILMDYGYTNVQVIQGGCAGWEQCGLRMEKS